MPPRVIHQIWIGPADPPQTWMDTWQLPGWDYHLWTETEIDALGLTHRHLYDAYLGNGCHNGAANVARVEIVLRHGGVYVDADMERVSHPEALGQAAFMSDDAWVVWTPNAPGRRLTNAVFGATAGHPLLEDYQQALGQVSVEALHPSWRATGGLLFTRLALGHPHRLRPLPSATFLPEDMYGRWRAPGRYAVHHWATTRSVRQADPEQT